VLALLVVLTAACSRGGDDKMADSGGDAAALSAPTEAKAKADGVAATAGGTGGASSADGSADAGTGASIPATVGRPNVVRTASLEVEVERDGFAAAFSKVPTIAAANGGFVASSSSARSSAGRAAAGSIEVRVPSDRFDETRRQLLALGEVRSEQLKGEDVGGQLTDLDARLRNLRSQEEAIRLLMTKTGTIGETIDVQRQLSTVREQIEQLAGEQARLQDAVAFSTLTLAIVEPGAALRPDDGSPLGDAVTRAVAGAEGVLTAVIVTVGYLLPLAVLGLVVWLGVELVRRALLAARRRQAAPPAAP
jgi:hypothetical protein